MPDEEDWVEKEMQNTYIEELNNVWPIHLQDYYDLSWIQALKLEEKYVQFETFKLGINRILDSFKVYRGDRWKN